MKFYNKFPNFDWKFYINIYSDLQNAGINTELKAKYHYLKYGYYEHRRTHRVITNEEDFLKFLLTILQKMNHNVILVKVLLYLNLEL